MLLTIYLKDKRKQIVNQSPAILQDKNGKRLQPNKLNEKMDSIARSIAGAAYLNHKFSFN